MRDSGAVGTSIERALREPGPANLAGLVSVAAAFDPDAVALIAPERTLTWGHLDADIDAAAAGLRGRDLRFGDRVAFLLPNCTDFVVLYLGALRAGLVVAPLDPAAGAAEVAAALADTGARLLVAPAAHPALDPALDPAIDTVPAGDGVAALLAAGRAAALAHRGADRGPVPGGESLAVLLQTAGTGGRPKRAMLSHRALLANLDQCAQLDPAPVLAGDVVLLALPLFHVFGLNAVLGQALFAGATTVLAGDTDPAALLTLIPAAGVSSVVGTPEMFAAWTALPGAREALAGVRVLVSGSAALRSADAAAFRVATGRRVWQGYGLTEAAPVVTATIRLPVGGAEDGFVGRPLPGVEVRVLDRDGEDTAPGDPGELWVRGANVFSGYWPDGRGGPDAQGWFATGDVALQHADGDLVMVSTRHDVVVVGGFSIYPREVEDVLLALPGVVEAAVLAVADERTGQAVKALLVLAPGAGGSAVTGETVRAHCAARLARFKVPTQVEFVTELPRSVAGKIARGRLRDPS